METFKKVIIKSESDLPKKSGHYFGCIAKELGEYYYELNSEYDYSLWMDEPAWYLLPLESSQKEPAEVSIDTKINLCATCIHDIPTCNGNPIFGDGLGNDNVIQCIEYSKSLPQSQKTESAEETDLKQYVTNLLYAAREDESASIEDFDLWVESQVNNLSDYFIQSHQVSQEARPTDQAIEKWARTIRIDFATNILIEGAKAMRDGQIPAKETEQPKPTLTTEEIRGDRVINRAISFIQRFPNTNELANHIISELKSIRNQK
jgi:hypothetical protein